MKRLLFAALLSLSLKAAAGDVVATDKCSGKNCYVSSLSMGPGRHWKLVPSGNDLSIVVNTTTYGIWRDSSGRLDATYGFAVGAGEIGGTWISTGEISTPTSVTATTFLRTIGVATGSLPSCTGIEGSVETDSTLTTLTYCAGTTRKTLVTAGGGGTFTWSSYCEKANCTKAETAADAFLMPLNGNSNYVPTKLAVNWRTAGVGGSTGAVFAVFNATDSTELCSCAVPCTAASGVAATCNLSCSAMTAGKLYVTRLKSTTDCGTIPGLIGVDVTGTQ